MSFLRTILFLLLKTLWTVVLGILFLPLLLFFRERMGRFVPFFWTGGILWLTRYILGIRTTIEGAEHIERGAVIYAMKHQSAYETLYLWHLLPSPVFVLKKELLNIPIFGQYLAGTPIIAIDRKAGGKAISSMLDQAREHLLHGRQIIVYPEGTRSLLGSKNPYKVGIYALYQNSGMPVIPVALNTGLCWPKHRFSKSSGTVTFRFLPPIAEGMEKAEFMRKLEESIEAASTELAGA